MDKAGSDVWQGLLDRGVLVRNCDTWKGLESCLIPTAGDAIQELRARTALARVAYGEGRRRRKLHDLRGRKLLRVADAGGLFA